MTVAAASVVLGTSAVIVLPLVLAVFLGWAPPLPSRGPGSARLLAAVVAAGYGAVVSEALPYLAGASGHVVALGSCTAVTLAVVAFVLGIVYDRSSQPRRPGLNGAAVNKT
ncbi:hypothetical protein [Streptomyces antibioticus]|uniref:hypothetical protein n=1 Tax=Streptomyces antibioticus TaxID=1890 RepID=UPI0033DFD78B